MLDATNPAPCAGKHMLTQGPSSPGKPEGCSFVMPQAYVRSCAFPCRRLLDNTGTLVAYGSARMPAPTVVPATSAAAPSTEPGSCRSVLSLRLLNSRGWDDSWPSGPGLPAFAGVTVPAGASVCSVMALGPSVPLEAHRVLRSCGLGTRRQYVRPTCRAGG